MGVITDEAESATTALLQKIQKGLIEVQSCEVKMISGIGTSTLIDFHLKGEVKEDAPRKV